MASSFSSLTIYRLRSEINGRPITDFADVIDPDRKTTLYQLRRRLDFDAELFVAPPDKGLPPWLTPLQEVFSDVQKLTTENNGAVLTIRIKRNRKFIYFACTFGTGRFLLRPGAIERHYGMRVALNAIYREGSKTDSVTNRLRSVDSK